MKNTLNGVKQRNTLKMKMTREQKNLLQLIDELLWKEWDPIGINDIEEARDEYRSYALHIFSLKIHGADKVKMASHLFNIETVSMGLGGNYKHCEEIADRILNL